MRLFKPDVDKLRARNDVEGLIKALDDTSAEVRIKAAYARGSDGTLSHLWFSAGWHAWESLGGQLASGTGPAVSSWAPGRLDVFTTGTDTALHHLWFSAGWHSWESLGGSLTSSPAAVSWDAGRIDVFARGSDGSLAHLWFSGGWHSWESLGGY